MFSLTIVFGPGPMVWTLMFKSEETAINAKNELQEARETSELDVEILDDFGQTCTVAVPTVSGYMLEDLEQSRLAHIERALHQARTQAKGQEIADADPTLRQARMKAQGGMPMIQPMSSFRPNGGFPS